LLLTDAAARNFQPGYRMGADTAVRDARREARDARADYIRQLNDAWRRPSKQTNDQEAGYLPADEPYPDDKPPNGPDNERLMSRHLFLAAQLEQARARDYERRNRELSEAWKSPAGKASPRNHAKLWQPTSSHDPAAIQRQVARWQGEPSSRRNGNS
jgi:hypothetical protein